MNKVISYDNKSLTTGAFKMVPMDIRTISLQPVKDDRPALDITRDLKLCIPTFKGFRILNVESIIYCSAENNYTVMHLTDATTITVSRPLLEYEKVLASASFLRVHRGFLINPQHVVEYHRGNGGTVIMTNGAEVEISRRKRDMFLEKIKGNYLI